MAEVFRAVAHGVEGFQRVFVIKRILQDKSQSKDFIDMFVAEARVSALLNHPNIVQSYDFGQIGGSYFISMEYLRGKDLLSVMRQLRATRKQIDPAVAAFIAQQVALGLHYAHSLTGSGGKPMNIVHRDVSPSNIMLLRAGGVKLLDFGIAKVGPKQKVNDDPTQSDAFIRGKLSYLSPEQIRGDSIDGRADVFSLGICLWEMLTGRRLFFDKSDYNTMKNVMDRPVMPPSMQRPDLPTALDFIAIRALERDNSRRYRNAKEMADELESYLVDAHFAAGAVPRLLDDLFGVDAGAFDAQMDDTVASSWGELNVVDVAEPNKSSTVPPVLSDSTDAKRNRGAPPAAARSRKRQLLMVGVGAAAAAAIAMFVSRPKAAAPPTPIAAVVAPMETPEKPSAEAAVAKAAAVALAAESEFVELRIETQPAGAQILGPDGKVLGTTPGLVKLTKSRVPTTLLLRKKGFSDTLQSLVPDRDLSAVLSLQRAPRGGKSTAVIARPLQPVVAKAEPTQGGVTAAESVAPAVADPVPVPEPAAEPPPSAVPEAPVPQVVEPPAVPTIAP
jgi:eukaryotic-like serine/threonine-protein kinase